MAADHPSDSHAMGVREAASALGLKPRQLKNAISAGLLPPARSGIAGGAFAVASFDSDWLRSAMFAMAERSKEIREARCTPAVCPVVRNPHSQSHNRTRHTGKLLHGSIEQSAAIAAASAAAVSLSGVVRNVVGSIKEALDIDKALRERKMAKKPVVTCPDKDTPDKAANPIDNPG